ncbi:MAG: polysaccharide pyruvyl transferase family protein [Mangrovibacterium sp.]
MKVFVIGQCTLHWGRLEYGNIGNYYITETTFRELHRVFPAAKIVTTFQMTDDFSKRENISVVPMELFYKWSETDLPKAIEEYRIAEYYQQTGNLLKTTPYIDEVLTSDLIIDFSGELWGDYAESVGKNRLLVGLLKIRVAQLLRRKTVLLAGSQGPFSDMKIREFAKVVFKNFDLVANRESASIELLNENGFDTNKVKNFSDPAFLFKPLDDHLMYDIFLHEMLLDKSKPIVGFILCGFNMLESPYDKWPRKESEFTQFIIAIEHIVNRLGARVVLFSHQNGFELPPNFKLINGRDYPYAKKLYDLTLIRGNVNPSCLHCINQPYLPNEIKAIIKQFDMLVTGRIHAFVAAVSQYVPSVIINRGQGPISMRNIGFARSVGMEHLMANPADATDIVNKIDDCWVHLKKLSILIKENYSFRSR